MSIEVQHLSHSFRTDAAHLIIKARCANTAKAPHLRTCYIAKLVVDAYMACECALKSLIASANPDLDSVRVYSTIRGCRHKLDSLLEHANPASINSTDKEFLKHASDQGVSLRYSLDIFSLVTCDLDPHYQGDFHIDQTYLQRFLEIADLLAREADERHRQAFGLGRTPISASELASYVKRLRDVPLKQQAKT